MSWKPPRSPFDLIQEHLYQNPWRLLVACVFCNLTKRRQAEPYIWKFFECYPTPQDASSANIEDIKDMIGPLGLSERRANTLVKMSRQYLDKSWSEPIELYGIGKYANDAWKIFCTSGWKSVKPKDHALSWYHDWLVENYS